MGDRLRIFPSRMRIVLRGTRTLKKKLAPTSFSLLSDNLRIPKNEGGSLFCSKVPRLRTPSPTSPHHHYRWWPTISDHRGGHGRQWWQKRVSGGVGWRRGRRGGGAAHMRRSWAVGARVCCC
ncbi:uncharacterized protein [Gossypium hirsutum]|uniref:Uncharacterized protein n=1 Tax=Gossypium hirsutum TaxID=3635 RepID=A0ABM2YXV5_GOSHI|nr:uncharacterized protein LOC121208522 [Gossypium hirsutum]